MMASAPALTLSGVVRTYRQGETTLGILRGADLTLWPGQSVALVAPSGAGKSTLLHVAGLLEKPDGGEVYMGSSPTAAMGDPERTALRRTAIGFVYQAHHLLPEFTALENVAMPQMIAGLSRREASDRGKELLTFLGLGQRYDHRPAELSGGEQQRVALARALIAKPDILLLDEAVTTLEEADGAELYRVLAEHMPSMIIISIGRPALLSGMHTRAIVLDGAPASSRGAPTLAIVPA